MAKGAGGTYNSKGKSSKGGKVDRGASGPMTPGKGKGTYSAKGGSSAGGKVNRGA